MSAVGGAVGMTSALVVKAPPEPPTVRAKGSTTSSAPASGCQSTAGAEKSSGASSMPRFVGSSALVTGTGAGGALGALGGAPDASVNTTGSGERTTCGAATCGATSGCGAATGAAGGAAAAGADVTTGAGAGEGAGAGAGGSAATSGTAGAIGAGAGAT